MYLGAFSLGGASRERIEIQITRVEAAEARDPSNWMRARVSLAARGFSGNYEMSFMAGDLISFGRELELLHRDLNGIAHFRTMEGQLYLQLTGDRLGKISVLGEARDEPGIGNRLKFQLEIDQTYLASTIREVNALIESLSVRSG